MKKLLTSTSLLFGSAALLAAAMLTQSSLGEKTTAPTSLSVIVDDTLASGPTIPPGDYDDEEPETKIASGPTIPPGDYDDEEPETKVS